MKISVTVSMSRSSASSMMPTWLWMMPRSFSMTLNTVSCELSGLAAQYSLTS
jgi:hypothetical protein